MRETFPFFNMKGILQNLTGCCWLVPKLCQEGKQALTAHGSHPSGTILVSLDKRMKPLTYRESWDSHPEQESGGICCLLQPLHENCFTNKRAGDDPGVGEMSTVMVHRGVKAKHPENQTLRIASHTENAESKKQGLCGISEGHLVWPLLQGRISLL